MMLPLSSCSRVRAQLAFFVVLPACLQPSSPQRRSSTGAADVKQQQQLGARALPLPCFLPVPESQPVLPALLRRLLQQGALPEALALATRHEGGPHFRRSLEWLLFTTLDMEAGKCKPLATAKQGGTSSSSAAGSSWVQHAVPGAAAVAGVHPAAFSGVLGRQGKVGTGSAAGAACVANTFSSLQLTTWLRTGKLYCIAMPVQHARTDR
jgi:hypothetical protein